jgi:hypothetical protein
MRAGLHPVVIKGFIIQPAQEHLCNLDNKNRPLAGGVFCKEVKLCIIPLYVLEMTVQSCHLEWAA